MFEVDLAQFVLFHGGAPNKAASGRLTVSLSRLPQQLRGLAMLLAIRRALSRVSNFAADLRPGYFQIDIPQFGPVRA
jgi:hypothetical protein